jgi:hypothetical protein
MEAVTDLVEFLRARLDEDERVARQHHLTNWHFDGIKNHIVNDDGVTVAIVRTTQEHIQRHDPARVLREVEAKRRIIDLADSLGYVTNDAEPAILAALALPYADHPDYREEWRP